ncbi:hypothetical protein MASR2M18_05070 [Ignavibacteria bacterium]|nr:rod shape-determining protein MreC [Bacteroidota bacterium]MCZ2132033.1 rod shape-determining protein MreC [Bacteroidota bacterium]
MYRIFDFIVRFREYFLLSVLVIASFVMMSYGNVAQLGGFRTVVVGGIGWLQNVFAWIPNPIALKSENAALRELNLQLSDERAKLRSAIIENDKLRKLLELKKKSNYALVAGDIVGKTTVETRNYATLNKGTTDGIDEGMPAITEAGLAGVVVAVSDNYSLIRLLINRDSRVAGKIARSRIDGILVWEGDEYLSMKNIPKSYDVKTGDEVVTSNYSNRYPPNITIGRVKAIQDESSSMFRKVLVEPTVRFSTIEQLFVAKVAPDTQRVRLEKYIEPIKEVLRARSRTR